MQEKLLLSSFNQRSGFKNLESDIRFYSRRFQTCFTHGKGSYLIDHAGVKYIDFFSGAGALNYGHNEPHLKSALIDYIQQDGVVHTLDMWSGAKEKFLKALYEHILSPRSLDYVVAFPGPTGTNAIELSLKFARVATGRKLIASFTGSFHGVTAGSLAVTNSEYHRSAAGVSLHNTVFLPYESLGKCNESLCKAKDVLKNKTKPNELPAAFLVETVQGEGGVNIASNEWLQGLRSWADEIGALLIIDDIQAGCGRTGTFFSFERAGIKPDIVCLSKSLSGYGLPLSLVLLRPEVDVLKPGSHNGTFRGFAPAFVTATATIEKFWRDSTFQNETIQKGSIMHNRLNAIANEYGAKIRGIGLFYGIEFSESNIADAVAETAFKNHLIVETCGPGASVVKLFPPLNIFDDILIEGMDKIHTSVATTFSKKTQQKT
jgi:diaminobutyrate-2-oxoglutarate transaminase